MKEKERTSTSFWKFIKSIFESFKNGFSYNIDEDIDDLDYDIDEGTRNELKKATEDNQKLASEVERAPIPEKKRSINEATVQTIHQKNRVIQTRNKDKNDREISE